MKFFYINNESCTGCDSCIKACPTSAIYGREGKRFIDYDKCTSCGTCYRECRTQAITIEKLEHITVQLEGLERYRQRLEQLENDNARLRELITAAAENLNALIAKLPVAAFICDPSEYIITANSRLLDILHTGTGDPADQNPLLAGVPAKEALPAQIYETFRRGVQEGEIDGHVLKNDSYFVSMSVYTIGKESFILAILRDMRNFSAVNAEISRKLKSSIDRQMAMVQKIGFLLGEEISEVTNDLDSVIQIVESANPGNDAR